MNTERPRGKYANRFGSKSSVSEQSKTSPDVTTAALRFPDITLCLLLSKKNVVLLQRAGKVMQRKRTEGEEREKPAESVDGGFRQ